MYFAADGSSNIAKQAPLKGNGRRFKCAVSCILLQTGLQI
jgi:hypothetical protein